MEAPRELVVETPGGRVSALWLRPAAPRLAFVLAHGAGAGMRHAFLEAVARALATRDVATFRYQFPYVEARRRRPDPPALLEAAVRAAVREAALLGGGMPLIAGGKSLGGRMTSQAAAREPLPGVRGLAFLGFPLHRPGAPSEERARHLERVSVPMLFLQGTRDALADIERITRVCQGLGDRATLRIVEGADHGFRVLRRSGRDDAAVIEELAGAVRRWAEERIL